MGKLIFSCDVIAVQEMGQTEVCLPVATDDSRLPPLNQRVGLQTKVVCADPTRGSPAGLVHTIGRLLVCHCNSQRPMCSNDCFLSWIT